MHIEIRTLRAATVALAAIAMSAVLAAPASAQFYGRDHTLRFRGGLFEPDGESQYWEDAEELFTGDASEFEDTILGVDYRMDLAGGGRLALLVSATGYEGEDRREDAFFVDEFGNPIVHDATLTVASFTAGLTLNLFPHGPVQPYVGAGGGYYAWELEERGDFVFSGEQFDEIFTDVFEDDGATLGYYYLVGLEVPINESWGLFGEARWHEADDDLGGDDFEGFGELDLSGREISAGFAWTF